MASCISCASNRKYLVACGRHLFRAILILTTGSHLAGSLRFTSIQMPALVQRGTNFWLSCQYELSRLATPVASDPNGGGAGAAGSPDSEQLYSVKWYRNNEEFYRLIFGGQQAQQEKQHRHAESRSNGPILPPPYQQQYFSQAGVNVLTNRECLASLDILGWHKWKSVDTVRST